MLIPFLDTNFNEINFTYLINYSTKRRPNKP